MDSMTETMRKAYTSVLDTLNPKTANPISRAEKPMPAPDPVLPIPEKPTELRHMPDHQPPPTVVVIPGLGGSFSSKPQVRAAARVPVQTTSLAPATPKTPVLFIDPVKPQTARTKDEMPAERLAAKVSNSPREALEALAKTRLAATKGLDRLGDKSRQLFPDREPER